MRMRKQGIIIESERIKEAKAKYNAYDAQIWIKEYFDKFSGGYNVYHKNHKFSPTGGGGAAEKEVGKMLAKYNGKQVEFLPEGNKKGPDMKFDEQTWDIKYIDYANENTIRKYLLDAQKADNAIFYWKTNEKLFVLKNASKREIGRLTKGQINSLPNIYYMDKNGLLKLLWKNKKGLNK